MAVEDLKWRRRDRGQRPGALARHHFPATLAPRRSDQAEGTRHEIKKNLRGRTHPHLVAAGQPRPADDPGADRRQYAGTNPFTRADHGRNRNIPETFRTAGLRPDGENLSHRRDLAGGELGLAQCTDPFPDHVEGLSRPGRISHPALCRRLRGWPAAGRADDARPDASVRYESHLHHHQRPGHRHPCRGRSEPLSMGAERAANDRGQDDPGDQ